MQGLIGLCDRGFQNILMNRITTFLIVCEESIQFVWHTICQKCYVYQKPTIIIILIIILLEKNWIQIWHKLRSHLIESQLILKHCYSFCQIWITAQITSPVRMEARVPTLARAGILVSVLSASPARIANRRLIVVLIFPVLMEQLVRWVNQLKPNQ